MSGREEFEWHEAFHSAEANGKPSRNPVRDTLFISAENSAWRPCFWNMRTSRKKEGGVASSVFEAFPHWLQLLEPAYFRPICNTSPCRVFARRGALTLLRKNQLKENNSAGESPPPPSPMRLKRLEANVHFSEGSPDWADCEKNHSPDSEDRAR